MGKYLYVTLPLDLKPEEEEEAEMEPDDETIHAENPTEWEGIGLMDTAVPVRPKESRYEEVPVALDATVLVVEDNDDLRSYIRWRLERHCRVHQAVERSISDEHLTMERLADEVAMSARNLQRRLRVLIHLSPEGYVRMMRMERAALLLRSGVRSVAQVAHQVGYADANHFARVFQQAFGVTPSEYGRSARTEGKRPED